MREFAIALPPRRISLQISSRAIALLTRILFHLLALNLNNRYMPALLSAFFCRVDNGDRSYAVQDTTVTLNKGT